MRLALPDDYVTRSGTAGLVGREPCLWFRPALVRNSPTPKDGNPWQPSTLVLGRFIGPHLVADFAGVYIARHHGRVAHNDRHWRHVTRYYSASADHCLSPDGHTTKNRRVGADRSALLDKCARILGGPLPTARKRIVGKSRIRSDKNVVFERDAVPHLHSALNCHTIADYRAAFDKSVIANIAIGADSRTGEHMRKRPDAGTRPDVGRLHAAIRMRKKRLRRQCNPQLPRLRSNPCPVAGDRCR
jgi:hypothetical protein